MKVERVGIDHILFFSIVLMGFERIHSRTSTASDACHVSFIYPWYVDVGLCAAEGGLGGICIGRYFNFASVKRLS